MVWQQADAPLYVDISKWFGWVIPDDPLVPAASSTPECVDYPGLYQPMLSYDCDGAHEQAAVDRPFWIDTGARTTHEAPWDDPLRFTNARIKISKLKPFPQTDACVKLITRGKIFI